MRRFSGKIITVLVLFVVLFSFAACDNGGNGEHKHLFNKRSGYCACGEFNKEKNDQRNPPTRADVEKALAEVAWSYYLKDNKVDYDSQDLSYMGKYYDGWFRLTKNALPEEATSDHTIFTVCSDFCNKVYNATLGYVPFGDTLNAITNGLWYFSEYPDDMVVMRWWKDGIVDGFGSGKAPTSALQLSLEAAGKGEEINPTAIESGNDDASEAEDMDTSMDKWYITQRKALKTTTARRFAQDWKDNLRPGDIIVSSGHALLYVGNNTVLDSHGNKYNGRDNAFMGYDYRDVAGSIRYITTVENLLVTGKGPHKSSYVIDDAGQSNWLVILRPLNAMCFDYPGTEDSNPDNDIFNTLWEVPDSKAFKYTGSSETGDAGVVKGMELTYAKNINRKITGITATGLLHTSYPGIEIDSTISSTPYGTLTRGETFSYNVKVTNNSKASSAKSKAYNYYLFKHDGNGNQGDSSFAGVTYNNLKISVPAPAGTTLISPSSETTINGLAPGQSTTFTVQFKVNNDATGKVEFKNVKIINGNCSDAKSAEVALPAYTNLIGNKLSSTQFATVRTATATTVDSWDALNDFYTNIVGIDLDLPNVSDIVASSFEVCDEHSDRGFFTNTKSKTVTSFKVSSRRPYLVDGYWGGKALYDKSPNRTYDLRLDQLYDGDILVCATIDRNSMAVTDWDAYLITDNFTGAGKGYRYWQVDDYFGRYDSSSKTYISNNSQNKSVQTHGKAVHISQNNDAELVDMVKYDLSGRSSTTTKLNSVIYSGGPMWSCFNRDLFFVLRPGQVGSHTHNYGLDGKCIQCGYAEPIPCTVKCTNKTKGTVLKTGDEVKFSVSLTNSGSVQKTFNVIIPSPTGTKGYAGVIANGIALNPGESKSWDVTAVVSNPGAGKVALSGVNVNGTLFSSPAFAIEPNTSVKITNSSVLSKFKTYTTTSYSNLSFARDFYSKCGLTAVANDLEKSMISYPGQTSAYLFTHLFMNNDGTLFTETSPDYNAYLNTLVVPGKWFSDTYPNAKTALLQKSDLQVGDVVVCMLKNGTDGSSYFVSVVSDTDAFYSSVKAGSNVSQVITYKGQNLQPAIDKVGFHSGSLTELVSMVNDFGKNRGTAKNSNVTTAYWVLLRPARAYEDINLNEAIF